MNRIRIVLNYLMNLFPYADKVIHFLGGFIIAFIFSFFVEDINVAFGIGMVAGLSKEVYDIYHDGHADWFDWLSTIAGAYLVVLIF